MNTTSIRTTLFRRTTPDDGLTVHAWTECDTNDTAPDVHDEGFWPNADDCGSAEEYALARDEARVRWNGWYSGAWHFCGVCVQVRKCGIDLTGPYSNAVWLIESDDKELITEVAAELSVDALAEAREILERLRS